MQEGEAKPLEEKQLAQEQEIKASRAEVALLPRVLSDTQVR